MHTVGYDLRCIDHIKIYIVCMHIRERPLETSVYYGQEFDQHLQSFAESECGAASVAHVYTYRLCAMYIH